MPKAELPRSSLVELPATLKKCTNFILVIGRDSLCLVIDPSTDFDGPVNLSGRLLPSSFDADVHGRIVSDFLASHGLATRQVIERHNDLFTVWLHGYQAMTPKSSSKWSLTTNLKILATITAPLVALGYLCKLKATTSINTTH